MLILCGVEYARKEADMKETTLCYIEKNNSYLMLLRNKKKIDMNKGKWIGVGGKLEIGETIEECLLREVYEETGLTLKNYNYRGKILFISDEWDSEIMHLYTADDFEGSLTECLEGELRWIPKDKIMDLNLWEGDRAFMKMLMEDEPYFEMKLVYQGDKLCEIEINNLN